MKRVTKILSSCEKSIKSLDHFTTFLRISLDTPEGVLCDAAQEIKNAPAVTEETTPEPGAPEQAFLAALPILPYFTGFTSEPELKRELLASIGRRLSYFTFSDAEWSTLYFTNLSLMTLPCGRPCGLVRGDGRPGGHVHAFEPSPENAARGEENMRINGFQCDLPQLRPVQL